jgi:hypothetical protein
VLRPGGFAGVRDQDGGTFMVFPPTPLIEEAMTLNYRVRRHNGGDPDVGRHHREYLLAAGFVRTAASATSSPAGTLEATQGLASSASAVLRGSMRTAIAEAWVTAERVEEFITALAAWGDRPDAFAFSTRCNAIGWVD